MNLRTVEQSCIHPKMLKLLAKYSNLKKISLNFIHHPLLLKVLFMFKKLEVIEVGSLIKIDSFANVFNSYNFSIRKVKLMEAFELNDDDLKRMLDHLLVLKSLELSLANLTKNGLFYLLKSKLEVVKLQLRLKQSKKHNTHPLADFVVPQQIVKRNIKNTSIHHFSIGNIIHYKYLMLFKKLRTLYYTKCEMETTFLNKLAKMKTIRSFKGIFGAQEELNDLSRISQLRKIEIESSCLSSFKFECLNRLKYLKKLRIVEKGFISITDQTNSKGLKIDQLKFLQHNSSIRILDLIETENIKFSKVVEFCESDCLLVEEIFCTKMYRPYDIIRTDAYWNRYFPELKENKYIDNRKMKDGTPDNIGVKMNEAMEESFQKVFGNTDFFKKIGDITTFIQEHSNELKSFDKDMPF